MLWANLHSCKWTNSGEIIHPSGHTGCGSVGTVLGTRNNENTMSICKSVNLDKTIFCTLIQFLLKRSATRSSDTSVVFVSRSYYSLPPSPPMRNVN